MKQNPKRTKTPTLLSTGDVLKTNPHPGYWGCALVLNTRGKTENYNPMCHIGITPVVFTHDYAFEELNIKDLAIMEFDVKARAAPNTYVHAYRQTCIGIYSRKPNPSIPIIGNIDTAARYPDPLEFVAGNGSDGCWPFCGKINDRLGNEAVIEWRTIHDNEQLLRESKAADKSFEEMLTRLKIEENEKRRKAKKRKPS